MKSAAKAGKYRIELITVPFDAIFAKLEAGDFNAAMATITVTEERQKRFDFSIPYLVENQMLLVRAKDSVHGLEGLRNKKVGADYEPSLSFLRESAGTYGIELVTGFTTTQEALDNLIEGNIDAYMISNANKETAARFLASIGYGDSVKILGEPLKEEAVAVAVQKGDEKTRALLNKGIAAIRDSGELRRLEEKWQRK